MELLVVTAVSGMVLVVLAGTSTRLLWDTPRLQDGTLALDEVLRVQRATRVDLQRAQSTSLESGQSAPELTLTYLPVGETTPVTVTYRVNVDGLLERMVAGGTARTVARHVQSIEFSRTGSVYSVTLAATTSYLGRAGDIQSWEVFQRITG